ncbi:MAG: hypothetical protein JNL45_09750 [Hyphomicrobium sp.]|jgi:hypothetical protein|nr:hypothetical protein [Hyphomicrobium sp.]
MMMTIAAEISAAPHFPEAMRPTAGRGTALFTFIGALQDLAGNEVIEENGELRLVSHPITSE